MDKVYSYDWYDGPRSGVATYQKQPYFFQSQWANIDSDDAQDWFKLSLITDEVLNWEVERWSLWLKYEVAFQQGLIEVEHHPFLPNDRPRGEELAKLLETRLVIDEESCLIAHAEFLPLDKLTQQDSRVEMAVRWTILPVAPSASRRTDYDL